MEPKFQSSFIPKRPVAGGTGTVLPPIKSTNIFSVIATILFILTLLAFGGLYGYKILLNQQIAAADKSLVATRASYQPEVVDNLIGVSSRIMSAKQLLGSHVVVSQFFDVLQALTVKNVRWTDFSYHDKGGTSTISMQGEAQSYNAITVQADLFSKNPFIKQPVFSDFQLSDNGTVKFKFDAAIDPSLISYKRLVESLAQPVTDTTTTGATTTVTTTP